MHLITPDATNVDSAIEKMSERRHLLRDQRLITAANRYLKDCLKARSSPRVSELARVRKTPLRTFVSAFEAEAGVTPSEYLKVCQLEAAIALLKETELPIAKIGYSSGFGTRRSFLRRFHKCVGTSPSAFRKSARNVTVIPDGLRVRLRSQ